MSKIIERQRKNDMSDRKKPRSLSEIVNDVLRAVRDYYDSE